MTRDFEDRMFDEVSARLEELTSTPAHELPSRLQPLARQTLLATCPDGSWPDALLLREMLRACLDFLHGRMLEDGFREDDLGAADRRWVDAVRTCVESQQLFEDMLVDLRSDAPLPGPTTERSGRLTGHG